MDNKTYINILTDTLSKKIVVLNELIQITQLQEGYFDDFEANMEFVDESFSSKEKLIHQLNQLDTGFDMVYEHVKEILQKNKQDFKAEINVMQNYIGDITVKSAQLQAIELKNKNKLDLYFMEQKKNIKSFHVNNRTAANYYKNMSNINQEQSFFLDKKK
ncbi:hypothetical protein acsn021_05100 [Anaerocolumna cellulosilytica]|uniref:Uncharacterized protein n=1 Tax=Anaerocolumna cellulosilytica TaxID=433286 RepID=A0A6S6R134_9FIRM|nr:hypothetical protein [Anaerocolumna cellulosilytica]MBB5195723.1 flagellar biosynthesis/type III secretory pathway chaperone [Anaerocolumna cellulosilytica]BCJ92941.1 hypothetical protein acsn021_05100 [Anaerocolumna cellulosilytica]